MNSPCHRLIIRHFQYIFNSLMDCCVRVRPNIVEKSQNIQMYSCLNWHLPQYEVQGWHGRAATQFEKASKDFVMKDSKVLGVDGRSGSAARPEDITGWQ